MKSKKENSPKRDLKIVSASFKKVKEIKHILHKLLRSKATIQEQLRHYNRNFKELKKIANEIRVRTLIVNITLTP
jgi:hypothetical protein